MLIPQNEYRLENPVFVFLPNTCICRKSSFPYGFSLFQSHLLHKSDYFKFLTHAFCFSCPLLQAKDLFQYTDPLTFSDMLSLIAPVHPWILFWDAMLQCEQNLKHLNWVAKLKHTVRLQIRRSSPVSVNLEESPSGRAVFPRIT